MRLKVLVLQHKKIHQKALILKVTAQKCTSPVKQPSNFSIFIDTAYDVSTASYDNVSRDVSGRDGNPQDITFKPDGTRMYFCGNSTDDVYQLLCTGGMFYWVSDKLAVKRQAHQCFK